jgi:hypothetical protein
MGGIGASSSGWGLLGTVGLLVVRVCGMIPLLGDDTLFIYPMCRINTFSHCSYMHKSILHSDIKERYVLDLWGLGGWPILKE